MCVYIVLPIANTMLLYVYMRFYVCKILRPSPACAQYELTNVIYKLYFILHHIFSIICFFYAEYNDLKY